MTDLIPPQNVLSLILMFAVCRTENQRWTRAIAGGLRGESNFAVATASITGFISTVFALAFYVSYSFDNGWAFLLVLPVISFLSGMAWALITLPVGDHPLIWVLCTFLTWPIILLMMLNTSWFGLS